MSNPDNLTNEDINRLVDFIVKPDGHRAPVDEAIHRASNMFLRQGLSSLVSVALAGDVQAFMYVHKQICDRMVEITPASVFVPDSPAH